MGRGWQSHKSPFFCSQLSPNQVINGLSMSLLQWENCLSSSLSACPKMATRAAGGQAGSSMERHGWEMSRTLGRGSLRGKSETGTSKAGGGKHLQRGKDKRRHSKLLENQLTVGSREEKGKAGVTAHKWRCNWIMMYRAQNLTHKKLTMNMSPISLRRMFMHSTSSVEKKKLGKGKKI